ncbi:toll/interleukin-1 receptor domain-containing protein [Stenomitos frigidus]|nr:toll/interleukin-1 receptor domain-containing protein [Stenomitos frigidus]
MTVHITFNLVDPALDSEELEAKTQNLQRQLREFDAVEQVDRVVDPTPPTGSKAFGGFLSGLLTARVAPAQAPAVLGALDAVVGSAAIEMTLEVDGRKITVKARNHEELAAALQTAQAFLLSAPAVTPVPIPTENVVVERSLAASQVSARPPVPTDVFFSYSHRDEELRDELAIHLSMLKRQGIIAAWHDREITAGSDWAGAIDSHLNSASVILLLVSANFLASDYCYDLELEQAMKRHEAGEATVIPIILKPCDWTGAPFGKLQALPKNAKPVTKWDDRDEAFLNVAQGIRAVIGKRSG